eukprot:TRINITY_DN33242_c0_g1_i1.p1 TRINITY_DN33242_c0_g1~~TRINITY_DN33242_c0_g1_i1.p1  ORF type:complete len:667 (-),score=95.13 TRINITY_DN33242_c0_g1_i1:282-2282(-)
MQLLGVPISFFMIVVAASIAYAVRSLRSSLKLRTKYLCNSIGFLFSVFFIVVTLVSIEGFQCHKNPNGKLTLMMDRSIICWGGSEHDAVVALSVIALLVYPIGFLSLTGYLTWNYHALTQKHGMNFIVSTRFLIGRVKPEYYFVGFLYNMRSFLLSITPLIGQVSEIQVLLLAFIMIVWIVFQMYTFPWRFPILNHFDVLTSAANVMMLLTFAMLRNPADRDAGSQEALRYTFGWIVLAIFFTLVVSMLLACGYFLYLRITARKEYCVFLTHHKGAAAVFARQMKLMIQHLTGKKPFLDVDELDNLDNLTFTVRTCTEALCILQTQQVYNRLWCSVEIVSAHTNRVPLIVACLDGSSPADILDDKFFSNMDHIWTSNELVELNKMGMGLDDVESAYTHVVSSTKSFTMSMLHTEQVQRQTVINILSEVHCPVKPKRFAPNPEHEVYVIYDTESKDQTCVVRILRDLLLEASWTCTILLQEPMGHPSSRALAITLISAGLAKNPICLAHIADAYTKEMPNVTVLSQEDFSKPDMSQVEAILSDESSWSQILNIAPGLSKHSMTESLLELYKVLAWRFNPQDTDMVMRVEFRRVADRLTVIVGRMTATSIGGETYPSSPTQSRSSSQAEFQSMAKDAKPMEQPTTKNKLSLIFQDDDELHENVNCEVF